MELKRTADIHEQLSQSGPAKHERKKDVVTTEEEYDRFFDGYDAQVDQILKNTPEEVKAFGSDASSAEIEAFAAQKAEDFSHFLDRIVKIGGETEKAFASFKNELTPTYQDRIEQHINPMYLMASTDTGYHQMFYSYAPIDTLTATQRDAYQLANKRMREPLFKYSLQTLTTYLNDTETQTVEEKKGDPRFQKEKVKTILQNLMEITVQTDPVDLDRCYDLLSFIANNPAAMQELAPKWRQKILYPLAEQVIKAGHIAAQLTQNDSPIETRETGIADSKRVQECADLFVPLLKKDIAESTTLRSLMPWHKLNAAQQKERPKNVPPPRYLTEVQSLARERTTHVLNEEGLPNTLMAAWSISQAPEEKAEYIMRNLEIIEELKKINPDAAKALNKEFGIQNFARQSLGFWVKQYQERDNHTTPYGVLLSPGDDWNGAFSNGYMANLVDQAVKEMKGKVLFRVIECQNKVDAVRKLLEMKQRYQIPEGGHAISFRIIAGHGTKNSIRIGQPDTQKQHQPPPLDERDSLPPPLDEVAPTDIDLITPSDIIGPGMRRLKALFRPDAPTVLISCSTGQEGGIGEVIAETHDTELAAPTVPAHVKEWHFHATSEGKVTIETEYHEEKNKPGISTTAFYRGKRSSEPPPL